MDNSAREIALKNAERLVRERYSPDGNYHPKGFYISVSSLVKKSAKEYAQKLLEWKARREQPDDVPKFYSFLGNTLSEEAFADYPHHEVQVVYPIDEKWTLVGHADAARVENVPDQGRCVILGEHKFHGENTDGNTEAAKRQGHLYLSLMWTMFKTNQPSDGTGAAMQFNVAPYAYIMPDGSPGFDKETMTILEGAILKGNNSPFLWEPDIVPGGVVVGIAEARPPGNTFTSIADEAICQQYLDFYIKKAKIVIACFDSDSLKPAEEWDINEGLLEFARSFETMREGTIALAEIVPQFFNAKTLEDQWGEQKSRIAKEIQARLQEEGIRKAIVGTYVVSLVERANGERFDAAALKALMGQPDKEWLRGYLKDGGKSTFVKVSQKGGGEE